jgi:hypothetical protein
MIVWSTVLPEVSVDLTRSDTNPPDAGCRRRAVPFAPERSTLAGRQVAPSS